jgi:hypothetical protein
VSVTTVREQLAVIEAGITGVEIAYDLPPASLTTVPAFTNWTQEVSFESFGQNEIIRETRVYLLRLYVKERGTGISGEGESVCRPFFDAVRDAFAGRPMLGGLAGVRRAKLLSGTGPVAREFAGQLYHAIEWRLEVLEDSPVTFLDGD